MHDAAGTNAMLATYSEATPWISIQVELAGSSHLDDFTLYSSAASPFFASGILVV